MKTQKKMKMERKKEQRRATSEERRFVKKWLGATVAAPPTARGDLDGIYYLVTAVDTNRKKILFGIPAGWVEVNSVIRLKSVRKKHWKARPTFVNN